jgi:hypothetical protein
VFLITLFLFQNTFGYVEIAIVIQNIQLFHKTHINHTSHLITLSCFKFADFLHFPCYRRMPKLIRKFYYKMTDVMEYILKSDYSTSLVSNSKDLTIFSPLKRYIIFSTMNMTFEYSFKYEKYESN